MYTGELSYSVTMNFTLHTEPNASVPEFTISCRTHGGPATTVQWTVNGSITLTHIDHETSQLILNTSLDSVYDNRFRVRGSISGTYNCTVSTTGIRTHKVINVKGRLISCLTIFTTSCQLLENPLVLLQSSLSPTVHMWISLCLGSHHVIPSLAM